VSRPLQFDPEWRLTLFTVLLVPLMAGLGFWQLQRAEEKAALAADWEARQHLAPAPLAELVDAQADALPYRRVRIVGEFSPEQFFLVDNKIYKGRFGYEVLAVFHWSGGAVLVNRGWIAGDSARLSLPEVPQVAGQLALTGQVYISPGAPYLLAEQQLEPGWPKVIQAVEMDKLVPAVGGVVFPYSIRLEADQPGALTTDWQVVNVSPEKHQGYALQWFTMAAVLLVFYLLRSSNLWSVLTGRGKDEG
jgi:cytochrome oxidase assembly protein ShyY1